MKAIISVTGKDSVGIIAKVSAVCANYNANITEITQSVLHEYFAMIMLCDITGITVPFAEFSDQLTKLGRDNNLEIHAMHEDIFNSMHKI